MQLHGMRAKGKRRFKVTTASNHDLPITPKVLNREFKVDQPDEVWAGAITCIATDERWLFLAVVIDLFSRRVIGWSLRFDMTRDIVIDALRMAWFRHRPPTCISALSDVICTMGHQAMPLRSGRVRTTLLSSSSSPTSRRSPPRRVTAETPRSSAPALCPCRAW
jgi:transposase InsO family protein